MEFESRYDTFNPSESYIECDLNVSLSLETSNGKKKFINKDVVT